MDSAFGPGKTHCVCQINKSLLQVLRNNHNLQPKKKTLCLFFFRKKACLGNHFLMLQKLCTTTLKFKILCNIFTFTKKENEKKRMKIRNISLYQCFCIGGTCRGWGSKRFMKSWRRKRGRRRTWRRGRIKVWRRSTPSWTRVSNRQNEVGVNRMVSSF